MRSLFTTLLATSIMTSCFLAVGWHVILRTPETLLMLLYAAGIVTSAARIIVLVMLRSVALAASVSARTAGRMERNFAAAYFAFALAFGLFCARGFVAAPSDEHVLLIGLVFGYGAGVATGISLRPWISIPSALIAIVPSILVCLSSGRVISIGAGMLTAVFLAGGIEAMLRRYRSGAQWVSMHRLLDRLDRSDPLTETANRIQLREDFAERATVSDPNALVAVHYIKLNQLVPVNEIHGFPVGDAILQQVSERLQQSLPGGDLVARVGGIEFVIVQSAIADAQEAADLARRMTARLTEPYLIGDLKISITACVGHGLARQQGADLDRLLLEARTRHSENAAASSGLQC